MQAPESRDERLHEEREIEPGQMTEPTKIQESSDVRESREAPGSTAAAGDRRLDSELWPVARALVERIGGTPLVPLPSPRSTVRVLGKAEWMNPGGSVKDRTAWGILRGALERADLVAAAGGAPPEQGDADSERRLLDASSGNTAIAYAMLGAALGIDVTICLPANASRERRLTLAALGVEVLLTDEMEGTDGASERARELAEANPGRYWYADQYSNPDNWRAHYEGTAEEIWEQTDGTVTHLVAGLGTTGTLVGTGRRLRELNPEIRVVAVQPATALHGLEGLKHLPTNRRPAIWDPTVADEHRSVRTEAAREAATDLARGTGFFVGPSAGAALVAARRVASGLEEGTIVTVLPDGGERYLSEAWWSTDERSVASVPVEGAISEDVSEDVSAEASGRSDRASPVPGPTVLVPSPVLVEIQEQLEAAHPAEGCGVLVGEADGSERRVERAVPARNRSSGRNDRYEIDPETLRDLMEVEDAGGPRVLGFYHSHPDAEPVPSATDRERSWPWYVYLIVRVDGREAAHEDADGSSSREGRVWTFGPDGEPTEGMLEIVDTRGEEPWPK